MDKNQAMEIAKKASELAFADEVHSTKEIAEKLELDESTVRAALKKAGVYLTFF